ncbi:hypothetical protein BCQ_3262 [Bacillus cereus Q1]|uniref:Uncharacterized protein n=1 Tax=Bacillus cereus (strain Q1) TaxID=361100 RepID=B9ITJ6_BACCQ|nr:hypothetical protein BCQ_3262 [Bacillus cereus Q1]
MKIELLSGEELIGRVILDNFIDILIPLYPCMNRVFKE